MAQITTNSTLVTTLSAVFQNVTIKATLDAYGPAGTGMYGGNYFDASVFGTYNTAFTIDNKGVIESVAKSNYDAGILLGSFGTITNTGTIIGSDGIDMWGATGHGSVTNSGLIDGSFGSGIYMYSSSVGVVKNSGTILGGEDGVAIGGGGSVSNTGLIQGDAVGVEFAGDLSSNVYNKGSIIGGIFGIFEGYDASYVVGGVVNVGYVYGAEAAVAIFAPGHVTNAGSLISEGEGLFFARGGTLQNSGLISSYEFGVAAGAGAGTIVNTKTGTIFSQTGILLESGGSINNAGTVLGEFVAVTVYGDLQLTNTGKINGYFGVGVAIGSDGGTAAITNASVISAEYTAILAGDDTSLTLTNTGSIIGGQSSDGAGKRLDAESTANSGEFSTYIAAISVSGNALINNLGLIYGGLDGLYADGPTAVVTNSGSIIAAAGDAIDLYEEDSNTVTNSGLVKAGEVGVEIVDTETVTVTNTGSIIGSEDSGVGLYNDLNVTITNGKIISGGFDGVDVDDFTEDYYDSLDSYATLHNTGTIAGGVGNGVELDVAFANVNNAKLITGQFDGIYTYNYIGGYDGGDQYIGVSSITNTGTVYGTLEAGVEVTGGDAYVTNKGLIYGGAYGIYSDYFMELTNTGTIDGKYFAGVSVDDDSDVVNSGVIKSAGYGIRIYDDLYLSNSSTGTITGTYAAAVYAEGYASISNAGLILSKRAIGMLVSDDAFISNASTGLIKGVDGVVVFDNYLGDDTIVNAGTIVGTKYDGINFAGGGTIVDTGTIIGKEYAVYLDYSTDANLLILSTSAKLEGKVYLGDGELELLSGSSVGTIGLGTVAAIGSINIASKADWDLAGNNTLGSLVSITNAGTIIEGASDSLTIDGSLAGGGTIKIGSLGLALNGYVGAQSLLFSGNNETLKLGDIGGGYDSFSGVIENFVKSDTIDITGLSLSDITGTAFSHGVLTISATNEYYITFAHPNSFTSLALAYFADGSGVGITLTAVNTEIARMDFATPASSSAASTAAAVASSPAVYAATASAPAITASSTSVGLSHDLLKSAASHTAVPQVTLHA